MRNLTSLMSTVITSYLIFIVLQTLQSIGHFFSPFGRVSNYSAKLLMLTLIGRETAAERQNPGLQERQLRLAEYYEEPSETPEVKLVGKSSAFCVM